MTFTQLTADMPVRHAQFVVGGQEVFDDLKDAIAYARECGLPVGTGESIKLSWGEKPTRNTVGQKGIKKSYKSNTRR